MGGIAHTGNTLHVSVLCAHTEARACIERCARTAEIRMHADWLCASGTTGAARLAETGVGAGRSTPGALGLQSHTCTGSRIVQPAAYVYARGRQVRECSRVKEWWRRFDQTWRRTSFPHVRYCFSVAIRKFWYLFFIKLISEGNEVTRNIVLSLQSYDIDIEWLDGNRIKRLFVIFSVGKNY